MYDVEIKAMHGTISVTLSDLEQSIYFAPTLVRNFNRPLEVALMTQIYRIKQNITIDCITSIGNSMLYYIYFHYVSKQNKSKSNSVTFN